MRTREEHLRWSKDRALEYLDAGNVQDAIVSMMSDVQKHPELHYHEAIMALGVIYATQCDYDGARRWIEGFR